MGTISEKLEYLDNTREKIKDSINLTGVGITEEDTFRSYAKSLKDGLVDVINDGGETLYNNFPKVKGTGTDITLNNTYEAPMEIELSGNTYQKSLSGKNLLPLRTTSASGITSTYDKETGRLGFSGTPTTQWITLSYMYSVSLPAGTYIASLKETKNYGVYIRFFTDSSNYTNLTIPANKNNITKTTTSETVYLTVMLNLTVGQEYDDDLYIQLEQGSTATEFEPYCGGTPSPNPDYPQDIEVVTGYNEVKVVGKNLYDMSKCVGGYLNNTNGSYVNNGITSFSINKNNITFVASATYRGIISDYIEIDSTKNYRFNSERNITATQCYAYYYDENKTFLGMNNVSGGYTFLLTPLTNSKYVRIVCSVTTSAGVGIEVIFSNLQLEQGSTATSYEPYQSQTYELNLGKNLFDKSTITSGYRLGSDGTLFADSSYFASDYINIKPNTIYTMNLNISTARCIVYYDENKTFIERNGTNTTFTTPSNAKYIRLAHELTNLDTYQLELGPIATPYSPYKEPIELCKIGDYKDYFYRDNGKWYKYGVIGKVIFDGTENWVQTITSNGKYRYSSSKNSNSAKDNIGLSSYFKYQNTNNYGNLWINTSGICFLCINIETLEDFKTWLSNNNVEVKYLLSTPTITILDDELQNQLNALYNAVSYKDQTNITANYVDGNQPFILDIEALLDEE